MEEAGLQINVQKTVIMSVDKEEERHIDIVIDGERIKTVDQFKYLVLRINHYKESLQPLLEKAFAREWW